MDEVTLWVGIDLGSKQHQVCVLNAKREVVWNRAIAHSGEAISAMADQLLELANKNAEGIRVALETPQSAVAEMLMERGIAVFSLNPKQLDRFRDRHNVAGAKDDRLDAYVLADSLSTDQAKYRQVNLGNAQLVELRSMSRTRDEVLQDINALCNRIDAELLRFYTEIRSLGSVQQDVWFADLLELVPTPEAARKVRMPQLRVLLKKHRIRKHTPEQVHEVLRACSLQAAPGVAEAASSHIQMLLQRLRLARQQERQCHARIEQLLEELSKPDGETEGQRDAAIVQSLAGAGPIVSAILLAEASQALAERDYRRLRALSGVAPVTKKSGTGKKPTLVMRQACNQRLRNAMYHLAFGSMQRDERAKAQYAALRSRGHSHGRALRGVADRILGVLVVMLQRGEMFDPTRRHPKAA